MRACGSLICRTVSPALCSRGSIATRALHASSNAARAIPPLAVGMALSCSRFDRRIASAPATWSDLRETVGLNNQFLALINRDNPMHERLERATWCKKPPPSPFVHNCREQARENCEDCDGRRQVHRVADFANASLDTVRTIANLGVSDLDAT